MWTCGKVVVFLFYFFLIFCTLQNFDKKVWTGGQVMKISEKKPVLTQCVLFFKSVDVWTGCCLSILFLPSFLYTLFILQKVWTGGQVMKTLKKSVNPLH